VILLIAFYLPACALSPSVRGQAVQMDAAAMVWNARDGTRFPFRHWLPAGSAPKAVVIGVHGLSGAACDLELLGKMMQAQGMAVYATELRGQGNDPVKERIGDIRNAREWHRDLWDFHRLVAARHAGVPVVWLGESLGSLIVCGAVTNPPDGVQAPAALVLASPIPAFDDRVGLMHRQALGFGAITKPTNRIALATWAGMDGKDWQMTGDTNHLAQVEKTPWAVKEFTVRFYHVLATMVGRMMPQARQIAQPVLIVRAAKDAFASAASVQAFADRLPKAEMKTYEKSHHLLFYDVDRNQVVTDITRWVGTMPWQPTPPRAGS
jgi:alpha-beta hydrolase superfamily lysophospholipase